MFFFGSNKNSDNNVALVEEGNAHLQFDTSTGNHIIKLTMPNEMYFDLRSIVSLNNRQLRFFIDDCVKKGSKYADPSFEDPQDFVFDVDDEQYNIAASIAKNRNISIEDAFLFLFQSYLNAYYRNKFTEVFEYYYTLPNTLYENVKRLCEIHNCDESVLISNAIQRARVMNRDIGREEWLGGQLNAENAVKRKGYFNVRELRLLMAMADYNQHSCDEELCTILYTYIHSR